jgi:transcriptional accessory protein Tex/SPT6
MRFPTRLARIVMFVALPLAVACADPAQVPDTEEARQEGARTIARLSVESGSLREMIDDGAKLAQASTAESLKLELKRELTDAEEEQVLEIFREALAEILTSPSINRRQGPRSCNSNRL